MPCFEQIPSREAGVLMALLGVYVAMVKSKNLKIDNQLILTRVVPYLSILSMEPSLNEQQVKMYFKTIKDFLTHVEKIHLEKLKEKQVTTTTNSNSDNNSNSDVNKGPKTMADLIKRPQISTHTNTQTKTQAQTTNTNTNSNINKPTQTTQTQTNNNNKNNGITATRVSSSNSNRNSPVNNNNNNNNHNHR